jgi:hypothetical protein
MLEWFQAREWRGILVSGERRGDGKTAATAGGAILMAAPVM